ncbi:tetratricopeptide repeat protein, partial [Sphaerotilus sp.]|uniref:tetratricopeptide repeat protein n=1 Tax=Sphaerotilus sp. TaxID=2093942 RepID=UPI0034E2EC62
MEQKRSRLVAPDATGLRARILSTGGLLVVAAMVLVLLAMLYPRQQLIDRLRAEPRNDELSVSYLANLLSSEPDNDELRILLAERHFSLGQTDRTEATLEPMLRKAVASEDTRQRLYRLTYNLLEQRANAARPGSPEALALRAQLIEALQARLSMDWTTPQLLEFARKATALEQLGLAQRFQALIHFDSEGDQAPWFAEAVRTALWAQDYNGAATLHLRALEISPTLERKRMHLHEALRILQSGNLLDQALAVAEDNAEIVGNDRVLLDYLTRLSLAANRPVEAQGYAKRLLQMSQMNTPQPDRDARLAAPLRWLARTVDLLVSPAQAAEPEAASPAASAAGAPAAGDPKLPFDDGAYLLAFQTFLANRNQTDAWRVAASAVRQGPTNVAWRERLAQVSEWVGKPEEALEHWRALATLAAGPGGDRATLDRALQSVLRLAPSLNDDEVMLSTWVQIGSLRKLTLDETLGIVAITERLGRPEAGMQWLVESDRRQPDRRLLETQVDLAERMGDLPTAIDALHRLIQRDGSTVPRAMRLARMHGVRGEHAMAHDALAPLAGSV